MKFFFIVLSVLIMVPQSFAADKLKKLEKLERGGSEYLLSVFRADFCTATINVLHKKWTDEILQYYHGASGNERTFLEDDKYEFLSEDTLAKSERMMKEMQKLKAFEEISDTFIRSDIGIWCWDSIPETFYDGLRLR